MVKKPRIWIYLDEEFKKQIKIAAAKRGINMSEYCVQVIEEYLENDVVMSEHGGK